MPLLFNKTKIVDSEGFTEYTVQQKQNQNEYIFKNEPYEHES